MTINLRIHLIVSQENKVSKVSTSLLLKKYCCHSFGLNKYAVLIRANDEKNRLKKKKNDDQLLCSIQKGSALLEPQWL